MDREVFVNSQRRLKLPTAKYAFADSLDELKKVEVHKAPAIIKPLMSSSGGSLASRRGRHSRFLECFSARVAVEQVELS